MKEKVLTARARIEKELQRLQIEKVARTLREFDNEVVSITVSNFYEKQTQEVKARFESAMELIRHEIELDDKRVMHYHKGAYFYITQTYGKEEYQVRCQTLASELLEPAELVDGIELTSDQFEALIALETALSLTYYTLDEINRAEFKRQAEQIISNTVLMMIIE